MALNVGDAFISMTVDRRDMAAAFRSGRQDVTDFGRHVEREVEKTGRSFGKMGEMMRGVFQGIGQAAADKAFGVLQSGLSGVKGAVLDLNNEAEAARTKINAFTKDGALTAKILEDIRKEASKTPFAFQEMANATGSLMPVAKGARLDLMDLVKQAEILAASNPLEGLEGASFALREAMTGDFTSIIERFNLSRSSINKWKDEGVSNFEIVQRAMAEMGYDADLVAGMADTMAGRWGTFNDTLDQFKIKATAPIFDVLKNGLTTVQGYLDANTETVEKYAELVGVRLAGGLSVAGNWLKSVADDFFGINSLAAKGQTPVEQFTAKLREGFAVARDVADGFFGTLGYVIGGVRELYGIMADGDFTGVGPWSEDSPVVDGLFRFRDAIQGAIDKYEELRSRMGVPLPSNMGKEDRGGPSGAQIAGGALAGGALIGGALALAPALSPVVSIVGNLIPMLGSLVGALGPVGIALGAVALAAGGLYLAWQNNLFGIRDTTNQIFPEVESTISGFREWFAGVFENIAAVTEPLRTDFLGFWNNELRPGLASVGDEIIAGWGRIRSAIDDLAHSQGVAVFRDSVKNAIDVVGPLLMEAGGILREDLGPAVMAVVGFFQVFAREGSETAAALIRAIGPALEFIGNGLRTLSQFVQQHSDLIMGTFRGAWDVISGIVQVAWSLVSGIILTGLALLRGDWDGAWGHIQDTARNVWDGIRQIVDGFLAMITNNLKLALEALKGIWSVAWEWIRDRLGELSGAISTKLQEWSDGLVRWLDQKSVDLKRAVLSPFEGARDAIGGIMRGFVDNIKGPMNEGIRGFNKFGGGFAGVLNWIAGKLKIGIDFGWQAIPELATGTGGPIRSGTLAWVGDGNGGSGAELAYLPPGSHVIPHDQSMELVRQGIVPMHSGGRAAGGIPEYAFGLDGIPGLSSLVDFFTKGPEGIVNAALQAAGVGVANIPGVEGGGARMFDMVKNWVVDAVKGWMKDLFPAGGDILTKALAAAEAQIGKPYQWGGNGDPSFDCSGFVRYVTEAVGLAGGMPRVVSDIYNWAAKGKHPLFTFGFQNPTNPDPRIQHMGIGIATPGGGMRWFEAGGRAGGIGATDDYWSEYGYPPGLEGRLASMQGGPGGSAPWNTQAPERVIRWLLGGLAAAGKPGSWLTGADIIAYHESGYDPNAINLNDINAQNGNPSMGLMQVIRDHFLAGEDPWDPVTNVAAASRYIGRRYGDMYSVPGPRSVLAGGPYLPYGNGGWILEPVLGFGLRSGRGYVLGERGIPELVTPSDKLGIGSPIPGVNPVTGQPYPDYRNLPGGPGSPIPGVNPITGQVYGGTPPAPGSIPGGSVGKPIPGVNPITGQPYPTVDPSTLPGGPGKPIPGVNPVTGKPYTDVPKPPEPEKPPPPPGTTAAGGRRELVIRVVTTETLISGVQMSRAITSEPIAIEDMAEGVTEVQARWEAGQVPAGAPSVPRPDILNVGSVQGGGTRGR